jgi:branched-chain amino acid transport system substrate-binding protein
LVALLEYGGLSTAYGADNKPEKLVYGCIADMTGPYAPIVGPAFAAFQDAAEFVNASGGVKGVPIEIVVQDCGGKIDVGVNNYMQMRDMKPRPSMIYGVLSGVGEALKDRMNQDQIPGMWVCSTEVIYPSMYTFGAYPTYADLCGMFMDWLKDTWKESRPPRVAFLTWDTTYGKAVLQPEVMDYAKSKGIEVTASEVFGIKDADIISQMIRIRSKEPDWIFTNTAGRGPVQVAKAVKEMGLKCSVAGSIGLDDSCLHIEKDALEGASSVCQLERNRKQGRPAHEQVHGEEPAQAHLQDDHVPDGLYRRACIQGSGRADRGQTRLG